MAEPVAIVVVTWNSAAHVEACLASAIAGNPAELVVIDNGSADDSVARVRTGFPQAKIVALGANHGFAVACNRGLRESQAPYVLFLNDDAHLSPDYLRVLVRRLEAEPKAASAIGKLVCEVDGVRRIDSAGIAMRWYALRPDDLGFHEPDRGSYDAPRDIFGPSGAAALYRRAALDEVGPEVFYEELFAYYEDVDLAWRLGRRGWRHLYEPSAVAHHLRRGPRRAPGPIEARAFVNRYLVWLRNEQLWRFLLYAPVAVPWELVRILRRAIFRPQSLAGMSELGCRARTAFAKRRADAVRASVAR